MARSRLPKIEGIPSPSLQRMRRMSDRALRAHLRRLETEIQHITDRMQRLNALDGDEPTRPTREARMQRAAAQRQHLVRLVEEGRRLLDREQYRPRPGHG